MLPDLDSLALFVRAAETRNLTRAAEDSSISVPAASRRLSLLENQFKAKLFERHSRGLELTAAGERLLELAREVIYALHHMHAEVSSYGAGLTAVLRIHGSTSAMARFLPADIANFQHLRPDIRVVLVECWSSDVIRKLRSSDIDLGVVVEGVDTAGLTIAPYRNDQLAVVAPPTVALPAEVYFADLLEHDLVVLEEDSTITRSLKEHAAELMKPITLRVQVRSFEAACRAVEAGLGIGVLPMQAATNTARSMNLRVLPIADAWASHRTLLCIRRAAEAESPLGALLIHLQNCAKRN